MSLTVDIGFGRAQLSAKETNRLVTQVRNGWTPNPDPTPASAIEMAIYLQVKKHIAMQDRLIAAKKPPRVSAKKIVQQQKVINAKFTQLRNQYQRLQREFVREREAHQNETAQLRTLRNEISRIRQALERAGLAV